ncbi:Sulfide:quinone oxidoreductase, mitochondrial [Sterolibacterium denitrificans]|uniref:Pyridine nucleotide-disulfide oxidoreductase n=2 Tax=Sterolibacterium denitrificans TaxID=157592 RepID=A0A656Z8D7_9PROT|nr:FAD/NAD(P)-binding oxidoreductase [Sterolibacterium denitrificans]KYC29212.1 pyridine nucleotide-disulfide oxidoreductase [Sterolibacterium denitrificans]SMB29673.1 Sulfide:quinone oxidoreductase, mitochondrial [Sterolibacterium denitrificans]
MSASKHTVVIIGGGTAGISVAAGLRRRQPGLDIAIVDPAEFHFYQPAWTLVGGGAFDVARTRRPLAGLLPRGVKHIAKAVSGFSPETNEIELAGGERLGYAFLVVAAGIQLNFDAIKGLPEALGKNGVSSNYRYDLAPYTWELVKNFKGGRALFTQPAGAIKCAGAPQKAMYLAADYWRQQGIKADSIQFRNGGAVLFSVPFYAQALSRVVDAYGAKARLGDSLVEVRGAEKIAVFERVQDGEKVREEVAYDLLHVVPPQSAPDFIRQSALANAEGWVDVDQHTLRHVRHNNIFSLGDCSSLPTSKTAAAVKAQAPVLVANLLEALQGLETRNRYTGYTACPVTTSHGKVMLAEFTYGGTVSTTLPLDSRIPRRFYWFLKRSVLPWFYWNLLLKGRFVPEVHQERRFPEALPALIEA